MANKVLASDKFYDLIKGLATSADVNTLDKKKVYALASETFGVEGKTIGGWASALSRKGLITITATQITVI